MHFAGVVLHTYQGLSGVTGIVVASFGALSEPCTAVPQNMPASVVAAVFMNLRLFMLLLALTQGLHLSSIPRLAAY